MPSADSTAFDPKTARSRDLAPPLHTLDTLNLLYRYVATNSQFFCFVVSLINLMQNPSLLGLFIPITIFVYAAMQSPRAPKGFWWLMLVGRGAPNIAP